MSEETPEIEPTEAEEKPKRRRRRKASRSETAETSSSPEPRGEGPEQGAGREASRAAQDEDEAPAEEPAASPEAAEPAASEPSAGVALQAEEEQKPEAADAEQEESGAEAEADTAAPESEAQTSAPPERRGAPAATPAPRRRRRRGDVLDVEVRAQAKYVRSSARKARLVCDHIRGKSVEEARAILAHTPRAIARDWSKLLESAVANAEHNHELIGEDLYVKAVRADEGPTIKRYRPRALGRATRIRKRTSHLTILLKPKP
jgi:ribosomal protein L22